MRRDRPRGEGRVGRAEPRGFEPARVRVRLRERRRVGNHRVGLRLPRRRRRFDDESRRIGRPGSTRRWILERLLLLLRLRVPVRRERRVLVPRRRGDQGRRRGGVGRGDGGVRARVSGVARGGGDVRVRRGRGRRPPRRGGRRVRRRRGRFRNQPEPRAVSHDVGLALGPSRRSALGRPRGRSRGGCVAHRPPRRGHGCGGWRGRVRRVFRRPARLIQQPAGRRLHRRRRGGGSGVGLAARGRRRDGGGAEGARRGGDVRRAGRVPGGRVRLRGRGRGGEGAQARRRERRRGEAQGAPRRGDLGVGREGRRRRNPTLSLGGIGIVRGGGRGG